MLCKFEMEEGAELVSRYMAGRRSQDDGSSAMRMEQDFYQEREDMRGEEDEDDEDEDYGLDDEGDADEDIGEGSNMDDAQGRRFRSKAWREFVPIHVDGEVNKGECKYCSTIISAKRGHGTSGLRNHLKRCKDRAAVVGSLNQMNATLMTPDGVSRLWKWDPDVARKALVRMVVLHELPLSIVEYDGFREDSPFPAMIAPMQKKLDKYWKVSWLALSISVILDPRFKFTYLEFRYPQVFGNGASTKLARVKEFPSSNPNWTKGGRSSLEMVLDELKDKVEACRRETQGLLQVVLEQEKRFQRNEQLQKKIACVLLPTTAAVWIFGPDKKGKSAEEEQASP